MSTIVDLPTETPEQGSSASHQGENTSAPETSLREATQTWIREAILSGRYQGGEKLIER